MNKATRIAAIVALCLAVSASYAEEPGEVYGFPRHTRSQIEKTDSFETINKRYEVGKDGNEIRDILAWTLYINPQNPHSRISSMHTLTYMIDRHTRNKYHRGNGDPWPEGIYRTLVRDWRWEGMEKWHTISGEIVPYMEVRRNIEIKLKENTKAEAMCWEYALRLATALLTPNAFILMQRP